MTKIHFYEALTGRLACNRIMYTNTDCTEFMADVNCQTCLNNYYGRGHVPSGEERLAVIRRLEAKDGS